MTKIVIALFLSIASTTFAQEIDHTGVYYWESNGEDSKLSRKLTIRANGTFTFDWYRNLPSLRNPEEFAWGKGTWTAKGKYIYFYTDPKNDLNDKYKLNFTNTKGRWDARNHRLILFESNIFWLKKICYGETVVH